MDDVLQVTIEILKIWSSSIEEPFVQELFAITVVIAEHSVEIQLLFKKIFDMLEYK